MRKVVMIGLLIFILLIAAVIAAPFLVPSSVYRQKIEEAAESALGRNVTISEDVHLRVFPRIEARTGAARIDNPEGFADDAFAEMSELRAAVKLLPLFARRVEIDEFVLVDPAIRLIKLQNGADNWTFTDNGAAKPADGQAPQDGGGGFTASLGDVRLVNGAVSFKDEQTGQSHSLEKLNITIGMQAPDEPLTLDGDGVVDGKTFDLDIVMTTLDSMISNQATQVKGRFTTDLISASIDGDATMGEAIALSMNFDADAPSIIELAKFAKVEDLPLAEALGAIKARGRVDGVVGDLKLTLDEFAHTGGLFAASGSGTVGVSETVTTDLEVEVSASDLKRIASLVEMELPARDALGAVKFSTSVSGPLDKLAFNGMSFTHDSDLLKASFNGSASFSQAAAGDPEISFSGPFSIEAPKLRALASTADVELPEGDVYRAFSLEGTADGSLTEIKVSEARIAFDDIMATGDMSLAMPAEKPISVTGQLNTGEIDATPYAVASGAVKEEKEARTAVQWEETPLELAFLDGVNVDVGVAAEGLKFQFLDFGRTAMTLRVQNGKLVAALEETQFYNGVGDAMITADTVDGVPTFALEADLNGVNVQPFLGALAQMNMIQGDGRIKVSFSGQGRTMADLMSSLSGAASVAVAEGALQGIDFDQLEQLSVESFVSGEWRNALSQNASTDVKDFASTFAINNGVASSKDFIFKTDDLRIPGQITLDMGKRSLGLTLAPSSSDTSVGLKGELPPITLTGPWGGDLKLGIDQSWIQTKLKAAASDALREEVGKQLGGDLGGVLSNKDATVEDAAKDAAKGALRDALGLGEPANVKTPTPTAAQTPAANVTPTPTPTPSPSPTSLEDLAKDKLKKELGNLFE